MTTSKPAEGAGAAVLEAGAVQRCVVACDYAASNPDPIGFAAGEAITIGRADDEYPGWHWCTSAAGKSGWVHESCFRRAAPGQGVALRDYTAREVSVTAGTPGSAVERLGGWVFLRLDDGRDGWVPEANLG